VAGNADEMVGFFIRGDFQAMITRLLFGEGDIMTVYDECMQHQDDLSWESSQIQ
jgi:hypothetical protein